MSLHPLSIIASLDPQLSCAVDAFVCEAPGRTDHPGRTFGRCFELAADLARLLAESGIDADVVDSNYWDPRPEALGMTDRLNDGCCGHYWTVIKRPNLQWAIDLSATQYGYEGPLAAYAPTNESPLWAGPVERIGALGLDCILQSRIDAGIPDEYLDPEDFDVWIDPAGSLHVLEGPENAYRAWKDEDMRGSVDSLWKAVGAICVAA